MSAQEPLGPFCQSCSMPLEKPEDFGTSASGHRVNDYCRHCFQHGAFTDPLITLDRMIDLGAGIMAQRGIMPEVKARALLTEVLPGMKRWQEAATQEACQCAGRRGLQAGDSEC